MGGSSEKESDESELMKIADNNRIDGRAILA